MASILVLLLSFVSFVFSFLLLTAVYPFFERSPIVLALALFFFLVMMIFFLYLAKSKNWWRSSFVQYGVFVMMLTVIMLVALVFTERHFRALNKQPGALSEFYAPFFNTKDSIFLTNEFVADSNGILLANPGALAKRGWGVKEGYYINRDGFRSREFQTKEQRDSNLSVLFLGDSYTWGSSAEPITNSFSDLVEKSGFTVFNTGIQGADPAQYCAIALKYVPLLKPDFCVLMFFEGNDVMWYKRTIVPYHPLFFYTNMGGMDAYKPDWIDGCPNERFSNYLEAYHYFIDNLTILGKENPFFTRLCAKTVVGTLFWKLIFYKEPEPCFKPDKPVDLYYFHKIDSVCAAHHVRFQIIVIPELNSLLPDTGEIKKRNPDLYGNYSILVPPGLSRTDYVPYPDGHLNNEGHKKYASFIVEKLKEFSAE